MNEQSKIQERLSALEVSLKRARLINIIVLCMCSCMVFAGFINKDKILSIDNVEADNISTQNIDIVDKMGKRRIKIGLSADQKVGIISIFGKEPGIPVLLLNADITGSNSAIALYDSKQIPRYTLKTENDTNCYAFHYDKYGKLSGGTFNIGGISSIYTSKLYITDSAKVNRAVIGLDEKDNYNPYIVFTDVKSRLRSKWFYSSKGPSGFGLYNDAQQNIGSLGIFPNGKSFVAFTDSSGTKQVVLPEN